MDSLGVARIAAGELFRPGSSGLRGETLWRVGELFVAAVIVVTNLVGAVVVVVIGTAVIPIPAVAHAGHVRVLNIVVAAVYVVIAVPVGVFVGVRGLVRLRNWLVSEEAATPLEIRTVLRAPGRLFVVQIALWAGAAVVFAIIDARYSSSLALRLALAIALTGLSTAACAYLLTERLLRPAAARALVGGMPERLTVPGVAWRAVLAWALGTGVPVAGLVLVGAQQLMVGDASRSELSVTMVVLGAVALTVGLLAIGLAARATADPVDAVRRGLRKVQDGDLDVAVPVYDGTQLGQLQLGFNHMVNGLAERERIREALGIYLDPDVAARVLEDGVDLEGEEVDVTVMFVDVRGFTSFAENRPAAEVVATLNRLFGRMVPLIQAEGGRVDKFVGDGLLAVFGAPRRLADHADRALSAAVAIAEAQHSEELKVGVGLNSGPVVAGNIGGAGRFEFGVIGDVVNTAARIEEATRSTGDVILLSHTTKSLLAAPWPQVVERKEVAVKGRSQPVRLYAYVTE